MSGVTRMNFQQIVQLTVGKDNEELILMTVLTQADFKGYSTATDNINMTMHAFKEIEHFPKFCIQQEIIGHKSRVFELNQCKCTKLIFEAQSK